MPYQTLAVGFWHRWMGHHHLTKKRAHHMYAQINRHCFMLQWQQYRWGFWGKTQPYLNWSALLFHNILFLKVADFCHVLHTSHTPPPCPTWENLVREIFCSLFFGRFLNRFFVGNTLIFILLGAEYCCLPTKGNKNISNIRYYLETYFLVNFFFWRD